MKYTFPWLFIIPVTARVNIQICFHSLVFQIHVLIPSQLKTIYTNVLEEMCWYLKVKMIISKEVLGSTPEGKPWLVWTILSKPRDLKQMYLNNWVSETSIACFYAIQSIIVTNSGLLFSPIIIRSTIRVCSVTDLGLVVSIITWQCSI